MTSAALVVGLLLAWRWIFRRRRGAAVRDAAADLPRVASELARSLRNGATLALAIAQMADRLPGVLGTELSTVTGHLDRGVGMDRALDLWRTGSDVAGVDLVVGACRFGFDHGGDLSRALDGVSATLLDRLEVADETRALVAQARTSATVLLALPPVGAAMFAVADPGVAAVLLGSTAGMACLAVGTALDFLGAWISARMIRAAVS